MTQPRPHPDLWYPIAQLLAALRTLLRATAPEAFAEIALHACAHLAAITALKQSMQQRHGQLTPFYASGAIGLANDGSVAMRDASSVPLAQRGAANSLVAAENADRAALYREIARANKHPEWEAEVRSTFALRWIDRAPAGWWVQSGGAWKRK